MLSVSILQMHLLCVDAHGVFLEHLAVWCDWSIMYEEQELVARLGQYHTHDDSHSFYLNY